jgi:hypothetical protein
VQHSKDFCLVPESFLFAAAGGFGLRIVCPGYMSNLE